MSSAGTPPPAAAAVEEGREPANEEEVKAQRAAKKAAKEARNQTRLAKLAAAPPAPAVGAAAVAVASLPDPARDPELEALLASIQRWTSLENVHRDKKVVANAFVARMGLTCIMPLLDAGFGSRLHAAFCAQPEVQDRRLLPLPAASYHVTLQALDMLRTDKTRRGVPRLRHLQAQLLSMTPALPAAPLTPGE